ncbi:hypothetical protein BST81_01790 [Leptolyngbya sp. 'hensonii']|uniref:SirB1 family protein n=1 Tax=Leptolyngbya sp. 'hensonii' TaxID=1922337 RepID=UPI00095014BB|nr:tetratricopeptide repeat protein [Leptolyngbya sp. 'hensonii']OLP20188.1 hypothetical protein BST81_01790 [Leptolyngbya sp. 'hensonii']
MDLVPARQAFQGATSVPDDQIDLAEAALYIAQEEYPELSVADYLRLLDQLALEVQSRLPQERYPLRVIQVLNQYLYQHLRFKGNTTDYYDPCNSFLNDVMDRRTGIPITLALVYMEIARRVDFPMVGIGMPGHFLIRPQVAEMELYVDAFHGGETLFVQDCQARLSELFGQPVSLETMPTLLAPISTRRFLARMLTNLKMIYLNRGQLQKAVAAIDRILWLLPQAPIEYRDRGLIAYQLHQWQDAVEDLETYLASVPEAEDAIAIQRLLHQIKQEGEK